MNWFESKRIDWIAETLKIFGYINREHLRTKFGISEIQASKDLNKYKKLYPQNMIYDLNRKCYVRDKK